MGPLIVLLGLAVLAAIVVLAGRLGPRELPGEQAALDAQERRELDSLRRLVDDLRETAWQHRELDSNLSTIILDDIRRYEQHRHDGPA